MTTEPNISAELQAMQDAGKIIKQLKRRAVQGDPMAIVALVEVAREATLAVRALWFDRAHHFDPDDETRSLAARREWLSFQFSDSALPVIHCWDGAGDRQQLAMLNGIKFGPFKARERKRRIGDMKSLIEMTQTNFRWIQSTPQRPAGLDGTIWDLPPLTRASAKDWAAVAVDWLWERHRSKMENPDSWLYTLARPEHGLSRDVKKRKVTLKEKIKGWRKEGGAVAETWIQEEPKKIKAMKVTPSHIKTGLKAEIIGYFKRNLNQ